MTEFLAQSPLAEFSKSPIEPTSANSTSQPQRQHVDLFNFDDPRFENYRYVLTSPRSIEACQRLGVKPVSLLPKSFARFQEEMKTSGYDIRELYDRFLETEKKRLELVELCRDERRKIVAEEVQRQSETDEGIPQSSIDVNNDGSLTGFSTVSSPSNKKVSQFMKKSATTLLPDKKFSKPPSAKKITDFKLAATFGLGVPSNFEKDQEMLGAEADKARQLATARAQHSSRLAQLKQQLEQLELETRMLRMESAKSTPTNKQSGTRSALRKSMSSVKPEEKTLDESWLMSEMKKHVDFNDDQNPRLSRPASASRAGIPRAQSAGLRGLSMERTIVSGVGMLPEKKKPNEPTTPIRQMISSHVDEIQRQVEQQRTLMEQSEMVEEWRYLIAERKRSEEEQARARRRRLILEKKLKAQQERLEKELAQRGNLRRLEEEEMAYRNMLRSSIQIKEQRTSEMLNDKHEEIERSRNISRVSEKLREDMRRSVNADSFDKKVQRVQLENKIGRGPRTNLTNVSKIKLG